MQETENNINYIATENSIFFCYNNLKKKTNLSNESTLSTTHTYI